MAAKKTSRAKGRKSVTRAKATRKSSARRARKAPREMRSNQLGLGPFEIT